MLFYWNVLTFPITKNNNIILKMATYKEDFQIERFDRERTQAELHASKEERESLKQAIQMLVCNVLHCSDYNQDLCSIL